ncbi:MAG: hypothetical protein ACREJN_16185 [Nitrospiraceae bacterium]
MEPPAVRLNNAIIKRDLLAINNLLSEAWFSVPESTECWNIRGFRQAVDLMDDLPEEAYGSGMDSKDSVA